MDTVAIIATLSIIGSIVGSIFLNVFSNVLTKWLEQWQSNRSLVSARKNADRLREELQHISDIYKDRTKLYISMFFRLVNLFMLLAGILVGMATVIFLVFRYSYGESLSKPTSFVLINILGVTVILFSYFFAFVAITDRNWIRRFRDFDRYKQETEQRIAKLEAKLSSKQITKV